MNITVLILIGMTAGIVSGLIGIGGGIIITPALILLLGLSQHEAQGTTLALLVPPIGLLAAWEYYKSGYVDIKVALFICIGFIIGGFIGSKIAVGIDESLMRKIFSLVLIFIGIVLFLKK
ncbi:MAG: permease [Spirochaetae bacterium HGW-Spirochaetae-1]|nr:MAG: permease [Spirochaetae bacterium HGW-Spirochaetae-1]